MVEPRARLEDVLERVASTARSDEAVGRAASAAAAEPSGESVNALGTALVRAGLRSLAFEAYEIAAALAPELHKPPANLANLCLERGDLDGAISHLQRAVELAPSRGPLWASLGSALQTRGQHEAAARAYVRAAELAPSHAVWHNLGLCAASAGRYDDAVRAFEQATSLTPEAFVSYFAWAEMLVNLSRFEEARAPLDGAARTAPDDPEIVANVNRFYQIARFDEEAKAHVFRALERWPHNDTLLLLLHNVLVRLDALHEGEPLCQAAIDSGIETPGPWLYLARLRSRQKRYRDELELLEDAARRFPRSQEILTQLAAALKHAKRIEEAESVLREVLAIGPSVDATCTLAGTRLEIGDAEDAMRLIRSVDHTPPDPMFTGAQAAMVANYVDDIPPNELRRNVERWAVGALPPPPLVIQPARSHDPDRRLRLAYVSADFRSHSVSRFMEPVLRHHDRRAFEIFAYGSTETGEDAVTQRIREMDLVFRDFAHRPHFDVAKQAQADCIDVLVDLSGWTHGQRIEAFMMKPAPVQITYLGYPATLGVPAVEYRITDNVADPPGSEQQYTETLLRLDRCAWAFRLEEHLAPPPPRPDRPITFGSFNNLSKVGRQSLDLFAQVLARVPGSRLLIKAKQLEEQRAKDRITAELAARGIELGRVELVAWLPSRSGHMELYDEIDIALDTYPYNGTTTTCEALWMQVPVVTLRGAMPASRVGHSLLTGCGLPSLCAASPDEYAEIAAHLASNLAELVALKRSLRERLLASELGDPVGLTRALERAYRGAFRAWVDREKSRIASTI